MEEASSGGPRRRRVVRGTRARNPSPLFRSLWFCAHAPKGCHLALVLLSWTLFSLLFCMPSFVIGLVSRQSNFHDYIDFNSCGVHRIGRDSHALDPHVPDISGRQGEYKDIEKLCIKGKYSCNDPQSLFLQRIRAEEEQQQKFSDKYAETNNINAQDLGQVRISNEIVGHEQVAENVTFRLSSDRTTISCFPSPSYESNKMSPQLEYLDDIHHVTSGESSSPSVGLRPKSVDWGLQPLFSPSVAFLTVLNVCNDTALHIFKPFSTNPYFYAYGFEEAVVAPGEMVSIAFIFLPRVLGLATGHLILQTNRGGFLIHAQGEGVESPYRIWPFTDLSAPRGSILRSNITLYNPFDELLFVQEVSAWISSSEESLLEPTGAICKTDSPFTGGSHNLVLNENAWFEFGKDATDSSLVGLRPSGEWEVKPHFSNAIMEIDISTNVERKLSGALCMLVKTSFQDTLDTVIMPLEAQIVSNAGNSPHIYHTPKGLILDMQSEVEETVNIALSLKNDGSELIKLERIYELSDNEKILQIEFLQGLLVLPGTVTLVARVTYKVIEENKCACNEVQPYCLCLDCKLLVVTNSTQRPEIVFPCQDLILPAEGLSESFFGLSTVLTGQRESTHVTNRFQGSSTSTPADLKVILECMSDPDDLFLRDWKFQRTSEESSVLLESHLLYPMVQVGVKTSKWVHVTNPSDQPVVMQLILSSEVISAQCKVDGEVWEQWQLNHSYWTNTRLLGKATDKHEDPQYGKVFFLLDNGISEAYVHPHGNAVFGPIYFQPSKRCIWMSSVFIRNNLSGVEWLPLQGAGGSGALTFLEGLEPIQALHFNFSMETPTSTMGVMKFYSSQLFQRSRMKAACTKPELKKILLARNTGDIPLEVNAIKVAGKDCGSNIFRIQPCTGFLLAPGESAELWVSYISDFSSGMVSQDLHLAMPSGILVIPLKASLPAYMVSLCQMSLFWPVLVKVVLVLLLVLTFVVLWHLLAQDATLSDLNQLPGLNKFTNAEVSKIVGLPHGDPVRQRSMGVLKPQVESAEISAVQCKRCQEQDTTAPLAKAGKHVHATTKLMHFHDGQERNYLIPHTKCEETKWLHDAEGRDLINSNFVRDGSHDKIGSPDGNNKKRSKSGYSGNKSIENNRSSETSNTKASFSPNKISGIINSGADSNQPELSSDVLLSKVAPYSGESLTVKVGNEKCRRRKKKSVAMTMKQDVCSSQSGNSTPSSPASPLTPVASSGSISPVVKMASQSNLMPLNSLRASDFKQDMESAESQYTCYVFHTKMHREKCTDSLQAGSVGDICNLGMSEVCDSKLFDESCSKQTNIPKLRCETQSSSRRTFKTHNTCVSSAPNEDWVTDAKRLADMNLNNPKGEDLHNLGLGSPSKTTRPVLTTSATFPRSRCREPNPGWKHSFFADMEETIISSSLAPSLVSTSAIAPHDRAPGTKLTKNTVQAEHKAHLRSQLTEQDSTYDIWGNHFADLPLRYGSNASAMSTGLPSMLSSSQEYSQSLFAKFAPTSHLNKSFNPSLS